MSSLDARDKAIDQSFHVAQPSGESGSVAGRLFAEAHDWFSQQSTTAKTLEVAGAVALGTAAVALATRKLHSLEIIARATHMDSALSEIEHQTAFAGSEYLGNAHLVSPALHETITRASSRLVDEYPELKSIVVAGGQSNGSFVLRSLTKAHPASDLDFYLVGNDTSAERMREISKKVQTSVKPLNLTVDGVLNGRNPEIYLNLNNLHHHIDNEEYNLMALPFQAAYGRPREAQLAVLDAVMKHPNKNEIWSRIVDAHAESLSMHHGSWSLEFNDAIQHDFLPQKVEKYGLPKTPEQALRQVFENSTDRP